ncbi:MAG: signal peptidase I [Actinomycetota bacterium]|nr:signal peptidase I [Actinomycetota bacterium]
MTGTIDETLPPTSGPRKSRRGAKQAIEWVLLIVGAIGIALVIKMFLFQAFYIPSESMVPTLKKNDRILVNKLSYRMHDVNRGDIIVFKAPAGRTDGIEDLVKRVIGLPGETVSFRDNRVYIDGEPLDEGYLPEGTPTVQRCTLGESIEIPPDSYFMMGDNRTASEDSRCFGPIPEGDIVGRAFVRILPVTRIGFL